MSTRVSPCAAGPQQLVAGPQQLPPWRAVSPYFSRATSFTLSAFSMAFSFSFSSFYVPIRSAALRVVALHTLEEGTEQGLQLPEGPPVDAVARAGAVDLPLHQPARFQLLEVLGHRALRQGQLVHDLPADAGVPLGQQLE